MQKYVISRIYSSWRSRIRASYFDILEGLYDAICELQARAKKVRFETVYENLTRYEFDSIETEEIMIGVRRHFILFFIFSHSFRSYLFYFLKGKKVLRQAIFNQHLLIAFRPQEIPVEEGN